MLAPKGVAFVLAPKVVCSGGKGTVCTGAKHAVGTLVPYVWVGKWRKYFYLYMCACRKYVIYGSGARIVPLERKIQYKFFALCIHARFSRKYEWCCGSTFFWLGK